MKPELAGDVNLCYEHGKYTFILPLSDLDVRALRTRKLMGSHLRNYKTELTILSTDRIALYPGNLYRMYKIPDSDIRIHLSVPITTDMDWVTPARIELHVFIYFEG